MDQIVGTRLLQTSFGIAVKPCVTAPGISNQICGCHWGMRTLFDLLCCNWRLVRAAYRI